MTVRTYRPEDREAVVALWRAAGLVRPVNDPYRDIDRKMAVDSEGLLLAIDDEQIVGSVMVGYDGHRGWVNYLGVLPDRQREGIGRLLIDAALELLRARGCPKLNLHVLGSNAGVVAFYERLGFRTENVLMLGLRLESDE